MFLSVTARGGAFRRMGVLLNLTPSRGRSERNLFGDRMERCFRRGWLCFSLPLNRSHFTDNVIGLGFLVPGLQKVKDLLLEEKREGKMHDFFLLRFGVGRLTKEPHRKTPVQEQPKRLESQ